MGPGGQVSKRIPGKLAMCKQCGFTSEDLAVCLRCRRKMPDDVKVSKIILIIANIGLNKS